MVTAADMVVMVPVSTMMDIMGMVDVVVTDVTTVMDMGLDTVDTEDRIMDPRTT